MAKTGLLTDGRMAIITVNYRGAADTIECLASLFSGDSVPYVIVADNASGDGSVDRIVAWAQGRGETPVADPALIQRDYAALPRPIDHEVIGPVDLSRGIRKPLTIIETGANLGFAGGNNQGLRLALATPGIDLFWLLNNDTIVEPHTVSAMRAGFAAHPEWGIAGTQVRFYHQPDRFQLLNGMRFSKWTGAAAGVHGGDPVGTSFDSEAIRRQSDFVCGASMAVTRDFLDAVGLMEERFFLYYEEIDWAMRGRGRFEQGFVADAVVYHKEGASAGSASRLSRRARSPLSEYHHIRSKMIFGGKHFPHLLPVYFAQNIVILMRRLWRRQPAQAKAVLRATLGLPLRC